jgi:hypothetical protein
MIAQEREVWTKANKIGTQYVYAVDANDDSAVFVRESIHHNDGPLWSCHLCGKGIAHTLNLHLKVRKR